MNANPTKRVLLIAFHFPPLSGSSGIQRTLRFVQHLPSHGWEPIVLTITPSAYEKTSQDLLQEIPAGTIVERAFGLDTARQLSIGGRYPGILARPDRWASWWPGAVFKGLDMIRRYRPQAIWSTYPIATAHRIAATLQQRSGLPWIADFRDPMAQDGYPADPKTWQSFKQIEENAIALASHSTFTTPSAVKTYQQRYPGKAEKISLLENGYDEESFAGCEAGPPLIPGVITLLHSGIVYPSERDPTCLFQALQKLFERGVISSSTFRMRFRAAVHEDFLRDLSERHGLQEVIEILPALPYGQALSEMLRSDGLLILQAANCNEQIPAKLYEYLRSGRPILGLTDPAGDTAWALKNAGIQNIASLDDSVAITSSLAGFLEQIAQGQSKVADPQAVRAADRRSRSRVLAQLLESATDLHQQSCQST